MNWIIDFAPESGADHKLHYQFLALFDPPDPLDDAIYFGFNKIIEIPTKKVNFLEDS